MLFSIVNGQYQFTTFNHSSGLKLDQIQVISEDSLGYLWLGSTSGLARFDGYRFEHFMLGDSSIDIAGSVVNDIDVTPSGNVVIAYDDRGLTVYDYATRTFRSKKYQLSDGDSFPRYSIYFVYIINDTTAFIGANREGLYKMNLKTFQSHKIPIDYIPRDMVAHPHKRNEYFLSHNGLFLFNEKHNSLKKLTNYGHGKLKILGDKVWFSSYLSKITAYNFQLDKAFNYETDITGVVRGWTIVDDELWMGMYYGIEVIDKGSQTSQRVIKSNRERTALSGDFIYSIYKDKTQRIWVGTDGGLSMYDPKKDFFTSTPWLPYQYSHLSKFSNNQILALDFYTNRATIFDNNLKAKDILIEKGLDKPVKVVGATNDQYIQFFNGIGILDQGKAKIEILDHPFNANLEKGLETVIFDGQKWAGIYKGSHTLRIYDTEQGKIDTVSLHTEPRGIIQLAPSDYLIYGVDLLAFYDAQEKDIEFNVLDTGRYQVLGLDIVAIDKGLDHYWISTKTEGVWSADIIDNYITLNKQYGISQGLKNMAVVNTTVDDQGRLIVQGRSDIFMYDAATDRFALLGDDNDIKSRVTYGLAVIDKTVHALGYENKSFSISNWSSKRQHLLPIIESIFVNSKRMIIKKGESLDLSYNQNNLTIDFSTIDYTNAKSIIHRYRLSGDAPWIRLDRAITTIHLASLIDGTYQLQLAAGYDDGTWYEPAMINFTIHAPIWKRWWFILSTILLLIMIGILLYQIRIRRLNQYNQMKVKFAELESESLRAQMNPHFVFNALNSIKSYIIKNDISEAADFLTTFSELIRAVLHNSKQKEVSLSQELEALTLYLQIENYRLNHKFEYAIMIDETIDANQIAFPPLIIQPFVENSIWHGFVHKPDKGHLNIKISSQKDQLFVDIIDDGVGRVESRRIEQNRNRKRSYGIAITKNRLDNLATETEVSIKDLTDDIGNARGTQVTLILPLKFLTLK